MADHGVYAIIPQPSLEDRCAIHDTLAAYGATFDNDNLAAFGKLIAQDAVVRLPSAGSFIEQARGHDALMALFGGIRTDLRNSGLQPRHYVSNILIRACDGARAEADAYLLYTEYDSASGDTKVVRGGIYSFALVKRDGAWLLHDWAVKYDGFSL